MDGGERDTVDGRDVIARLGALRADHPDARVSTELVRLDDSFAVVRIEITVPGGGLVSAHGTSPAGRADVVEDAEVRALNRALTMVGYGLARIQPAREPSEPRVAEGVTERIPTPTERAPVEAEPEPAPTPSTPRQSAQAAAPQAVQSDTEAEPPLEDYSWTAFWNWARKLGYQNKTEVEDLIGESITSLSPAQVRNLLRDKTGAD